MIPPNRPCVREDEPDRLYATVAEKEEAVVGEVAAAHATGRPVLIGTLDVAESERLAGELGRGRAAVRRAQRQERRRGGRDHRRGRGATARSPCPPRWPAAAPTSASAARERRPGPGRRAGRAVRDRHRPAREQPARRPAARAGRPPGRPGRLGLLRQHGGRAGRPVRAGRGRAARSPPTAWSPTRGRTGRWATPSASPRASTWRSTATPGATASSSRTSGAWCSHHRDRVLRADDALSGAGQAVPAAAWRS